MINDASVQEQGNYTLKEKQHSQKLPSNSGIHLPVPKGERGSIYLHGGFHQFIIEGHILLLPQRGPGTVEKMARTLHTPNELAIPQNSGIMKIKFKDAFHTIEQ